MAINSLDVYNIATLVDSHVWGQRNNSTVPRRPRGHIANALCFVTLRELAAVAKSNAGFL